MTPRPHPFLLVFGGIAPSHFPAIQEAVGELPSLDEFLLAQAVVELLQELRPEDGIGDAMEDFVAFAHAAFVFWANDAITRELDLAATLALCANPGPAIGPAPTIPQYIQVSSRRIWAQLDAESAHEPLDGWFAIPDAAGMRMVACFGVHPERPGLSVVSVVGPAPRKLVREDGTPLFGPTMSGGDLAALHAVAAPEELLLLGWRAGLAEGGGEWP